MDFVSNDLSTATRFEREAFVQVGEQIVRNFEDHATVANKNPTWRFSDAIVDDTEVVAWMLERSNVCCFVSTNGILFKHSTAATKAACSTWR